MVLLMTSGIVCAVEPDRVLILQDENYFLKDENRRLKEELARSQDAASRLPACQAVVAEKQWQNDALEKDLVGRQVKLDELTGEKLALRASLKVVGEQLDAQKKDAGLALAREQAEWAQENSALLAKVTVKDKVVQEKIVLAQKPLQDEIATLQEKLKVREASALRDKASLNAQMDDKVQKMQQQIAALRESAGQEVQKLMDSSAAEIKALKDKLAVCPSADPARK